ncbi:MAG: hypothetical protein J0H99_23930, partial [Rhodospirillales bacterium]|nr:hypothetical protein [Rhodospirillales bacterium]
MAVARLAALGMLLILASCTVGPDFKEPPWYSPASWFGGGHRESPPVHSQLVADPIDPRWWNLFGDSELTSLEERVARDNFDVRVATIQLRGIQRQIEI